MHLVAYQNFKRHGDGSAAADPLVAQSSKVGDRYAVRGRLPWRAPLGTWREDRNGGTGLLDTTGGGAAHLVVDSGSSDGMVETLLSTLSGDNAGLCYRASGSSFIRVVSDNASTYFQWTNNGSSFTTVATAVAGSVLGVPLRVVFQGTRHKVYRDGVLIKEFTYSGNLKETLHGVHHRNGTGHRTAYCAVWAPDPADLRASLPAEVRRRRLALR